MLNKVTAIIPAFNEEKTIKAVVSEAGMYVDEVIVVDDGSSDKTAVLAREAGAYVYSHTRNMFYGEAIRSGIRTAVERGATFAVLLDADGQHSPSYIPCVLSPVINGGADIAIASRFISHKKCIPFIRRLGISFVNFVFNLFNNCSITDTQSGFRAFSYKAMCMQDFQEKGMGFSVEFISRAIGSKLNIVEVPVPCNFDISNKANLSLIIQGVTVLSAMARCKIRAIYNSFTDGLSIANKRSGHAYFGPCGYYSGTGWHSPVFCRESHKEGV